MTTAIGPDERAYRTLIVAGLERSRQVIRIAQQLELFGGSATEADAQYGDQFVPAANLVHVVGTAEDVQRLFRAIGAEDRQMAGHYVPVVGIRLINFTDMPRPLL